MEEVNTEIIPFKRETIKELKSMDYNNYPVVYILHNNSKKLKAYIGETVQIRNRLNNHWKDKKKTMDKAVIISHNHFNQKYELLNKSQTTSSVTHNYYDKPKYDYDIFNDLWEKLRQDKLVDGTLEYLENKDIFKLSPYKELSESQIELKENILEFCIENIKHDKPAVYFIKGEAGTGKSVVLSSTFNAIQDLSKDEHSKLEGTNNHLLVNHEEMIKTYKTIAESTFATFKRRSI